MSETNGDHLPEFDNPVSISKHRLDEEWDRQAELVRMWGEKLADARLAWSDAKADLDVVRAEVGRSIREDPAKFAVLKPTVDAVNDAITMHPKVINAVKKVNRLKHKLDVIEAMCNALEHKKKALEMEVTLFLNSYYAEPRQPKDPETRERFQQHRSDKVAESMKSKSRRKK